MTNQISPDTLEWNAVRGAFHRPLPFPEANICKIIIVSAYKDFMEERDLFWTEVVPELQIHCLQYGMELVIVDPHQGYVGPGGSNDIILPDDLATIEREIIDARESSIGVYVVAMMGDDYGCVPLPCTFSKYTFQQIRQIVVEGALDVHVLDRFYKLNRVKTPHIYELRWPKEWDSVQDHANQFSALYQVVMTAAKRLSTNNVAKKDSNPDHSSSLFQTSWLDHCIQSILQASGSKSPPSISAPSSKSPRHFFVLRGYTPPPGAYRVTDLSRDLVADSTFIDEDTDPPTDGTDVSSMAGLQVGSPKTRSERLEALKNKISEVVDKPNLESFLLPALKSRPVNGSNASTGLFKAFVDSDQDAHAKYTEQFGPHLAYKLKQLINSAVAEKSTSSPTVPASDRRPSAGLKSPTNLSQPGQISGPDPSGRSSAITEAVFHASLFSAKLSQSCQPGASPKSRRSDGTNIQTDRQLTSHESFKKAVRFIDGDSDKTGHILGIFGEEGSGKSTFLAQLGHYAAQGSFDAVKGAHSNGHSSKTTSLTPAERNPTQAEAKCVVIARRIATSPSTWNFEEMLQSICEQICAAYSVSPEKILTESTPAQSTCKTNESKIDSVIDEETLGVSGLVPGGVSVVQRFQRTIAWVSKKAGDKNNKGRVPPLTILLDDVHLLKDSKLIFTGRYKRWLPDWNQKGSLPHVRIVYTAIKAPITSKPSSTAQTQNPPQNTLIPPKILNLSTAEVPPASLIDLSNPSLWSRDALVEYILQPELASRGIELSPEMRDFAHRCLQSFSSVGSNPSPGPLYAQCLAEYLGASTMLVDFEEPSPDTVNTVFSLVDLVLSKMETTFSRPVMASVCAYIECAHYGVTEGELLDLLSLDNDVMHQVEKQYEKSDDEEGCSSVRRFPSIVLAKIRHSMGLLIETVVFDSSRFLRWRHQCFREVVKRKYLTTTGQRKKIHTAMADLLLHTAIDEDAISVGRSSNSQIIAPRNLRYHVGDSIVYNTRRIRELWFHLLNTGNIERLKEYALCNFEYLFALLRTCGVAHMLAVFEATMYQVLHRDFYAFYSSVLLPNLHLLNRDPLLFAGECIGRLRYTKETNGNYLNKLVEQAMVWVDNYSGSPLLVPLTCWIKPPSQPLAFSFQLQNWASKNTVIMPSLNYQHLLVGGDQGGDIRMYHLASQTLVRTFSGNSDAITNIKLSHNGFFFVCSCKNGTLRSWDILLGTPKKTFKPHTKTVTCFAITRDDQRLVTGSTDGTAKVVCLHSGRVLQSFHQRGCAVLALTLTDDSEILIIGADDFQIHIWNMGAEMQISQLSGLMAPVTTLVLSSNDAFLLVVCEDESVHVMSVVAATELHQIKEDIGKVCSMAIAQDDCQVFVGTQNGDLYAYDLHNAQPLKHFRGFSASSKPMTSLKFTADGKFLISASGDQIRVWNFLSYNEKSAKKFELTSKSGGYYAKNGYHIQPPITSQKASTASKMSMTVLDRNRTASPENSNGSSSARQTEIELIDHRWSNPPHIQCATMSANYKFAAAGFEFGIVKCWEIDACEIQWAHQPLDSDVTALDFTKDGHFIVAGSVDGSIKALKVSNGATVKAYYGHSTSIVSIQTFHDAYKVLSTDTTATTHIWSAEDLKPTLSSHPGSLSAISTTTTVTANQEENPVVLKGLNQNLVRVASNDTNIIGVLVEAKREARVWHLTATSGASDANYGPITCAGKLNHSADITCLIVSKDADRVVTGSKDESLKVWETQTGFLTQVLVGHDGPVTCCAILQGNKSVVSGSLDHCVILWDVDTGSALHTMYKIGIGSPLRAVTTSADGVLVIAGYEDGELCVFSLNNGVLITSFSMGEMSIDSIQMSPDASRIIVAPSVASTSLPNLPVLCLHNTPAGLLPNHGASYSRKSTGVRSNRPQMNRGSSISSGGSKTNSTSAEHH